MYPAPTGINNEIMASGMPSKRLAVQESFPRVARAGTRTAADGIQKNLFTLPKLAFLRAVECIIAASIANLHASKYCCAHYDQSLFRLITVARSGDRKSTRLNSSH